MAPPNQITGRTASVAFAFQFESEPVCEPAMTDPNQPSHPIDARPSAGDIWNVADFLEIQSIVGRERAETLLRSYIMFLGRTLLSLEGEARDARQMRESAHDLKSMSGQLGFEALRRFCDGILAKGAGPTEAADRQFLALIKASASAAEFYCQAQRAAA
jgi:hypothetical protein